jgi:RNA polymerase sigma factor (sigma-70 family)
VDAARDEALWARSRQGDADAFGELFDRHHPRVYRHALRLLNDRADAEDVTAATFLELWRHRHRVRIVNGSILPWLLVTTTNLARNTERSIRRYRQLLQRLPRQDDVPDAADVALGDVLDNDEQLGAALRSLRHLDRQLIVLVVLEGFPIAEAATVLGLSPTAAKTRLHRARTRLRQDLTGHPEALRHLAHTGDSA